MPTQLPETERDGSVHVNCEARPPAVAAASASIMADLRGATSGGEVCVDLSIDAHIERCSPHGDVEERKMRRPGLAAWLPHEDGWDAVSAREDPDATPLVSKVEAAIINKSRYSLAKASFTGG